MGGGRNCTLGAVAGEPISKWTCKCRRGYWDSGKQEAVLGGPIGRGEAATRAEYEAHKSGCTACRDQAEEDDWNSLHTERQRPLEPVCSVERRFTDRHAKRERWDAPLESKVYGDSGAEQPAQAESARYIPRDSMWPSPRSQRIYSDSATGGTDSSRHGDAPLFTLFPQEDVAHRTITTPSQPSAERPQVVRAATMELSSDSRGHSQSVALPRRGDTLRRDLQEHQRRGSVAGGRQHDNVDSRDRANIQEVGRHLDSGIQTQMLPPQSRRLTSLAQRFLDLGLGRYSESARFISDNPEIMEQSEIDCLVAEASFVEKAGQSKLAQTCIHQALLLRECKTRGLKEAVIFIRKLDAMNTKARQDFVRDVKKVYISIQEQARKSLQQGQTVALEPYGRNVSSLSQATDSTSPQAPSIYGQSPPGTTQAQAQVSRDRDRRLLYRDEQGRELRPASSRHDSSRHRAVVSPAQTTTQQHRGATSESNDRKQLTVSQTAERTGYTGSATSYPSSATSYPSSVTSYPSSATSRDVPDLQQESGHPRQDVSEAMSKVQISTGPKSYNQLSRADAEKEVLDRLRRSRSTPISRRELDRLIEDQLTRAAKQKR